MRRSALRRHANAVLRHELRRARARLAALPGEGRCSVEEVTSQVTDALVEALLEQARREPALAQALVSIYGHERSWEPQAPVWVAD
jgi:Glutamyl-tRNAGlu reductase, dimerisation domain